ncbi:hypothetical protein YC2023_072827 [Brassica napus]
MNVLSDGGDSDLPVNWASVLLRDRGRTLIPLFDGRLLHTDTEIIRSVEKRSAFKKEMTYTIYLSAVAPVLGSHEHHPLT